MEPFETPNKHFQTWFDTSRTTAITAGTWKERKLDTNAIVTALAEKVVKLV